MAIQRVLAYWVVGNQRAGCKTKKKKKWNTITDQWGRRASVQTTFGSHPDPQICLEMFSGTGIGPMLNVESAPPRGKTYIHETKSHRLASCVAMALRGVAALNFCQRHVLVPPPPPPPPPPRGMECLETSLLCSNLHYSKWLRQSATLNAWRLQKENAHKLRVHGLSLYRWVRVDILMAESSIIT